jgi:LmbE family N-acetylglucosaminyl deacetylase
MMLASKKSLTSAVIVAHPDDETLWAGGTILSHPSWEWFVISLCRGSDMDRSTKFYRVLEILKAEGTMGDIDDGPEQNPVSGSLLEETIIKLLPQKRFDIIFTHSPNGEYTRHIRHEETGKAVLNLKQKKILSASVLWTFAYQDGNRAHYPKAVETADYYRKLPEIIWQKKYQIITDVYGFGKDSWEARTTPSYEAFWKIMKNKSNTKIRIK